MERYFWILGTLLFLIIFFVILIWADRNAERVRAQYLPKPKQKEPVPPIIRPTKETSKNAPTVSGSTSTGATAIAYTVGVNAASDSSRSSWSDSSSGSDYGGGSSSTF